MKRRKLSMDPDEFLRLKNEGAGYLVERNLCPQDTKLINPFVVAKHDSGDLVQLAKEIQTADVMVRATTCSKLQMIAEQMRFLQQQAHRVLMEAKETSQLHHVACNFHKLPGHIYFLYERPSGQQYFSILSPQDWSNSGGPPHKYVGAFRLEQDLSWTPEALFSSQSEQFALLDKLLTNDDMEVSKRRLELCLM